MSTDWFERVTGFAEQEWSATQRLLIVEDDELVSAADGTRWRVGSLTMPTVASLRADVPHATRTVVSAMTGDARALHSDPGFSGAVFQVASQFNLLEMVGPSVTPEDGVTGYVRDRTQGPACAVAAGAATIVRNYLADVDGHAGQTASRQLDGLRGVGEALSARLGVPVTDLWDMRNGYALCTARGLAMIADVLASAADSDEIRGLLAVGVHADVQVTDLPADESRLVTQVFCSALPVAYGVPSPHWEPFARLVLEGTYEATLRTAAARGPGTVLLLTRVGGGVFGNAEAWIDDAIERALLLVEHAGLDVRLVGYRQVHPSAAGIARRWGGEDRG